MFRSSKALIVAALLATIAIPSGAAPIEITVGKDNAKRSILPGGGKDPAQSFRDCADCPEMVVLPAGSFMMGSPENEPGRKRSEGPQHQVTIAKPFAVGKFEVTAAEWEACRAERCLKISDEGWGGGKRPAINVNEQEFNNFLEWLRQKTGKQYRLLTEAEWEYAARAGTSTPYATGATLDTKQARAGEEPWSPDAKTAEVGSYPPNAFGLYDMHGNVWEWVADCWHENYDGAPQDGSQWMARLSLAGTPLQKCAPGDTNYHCKESCDARVLRGGSWGSNANLVRSAARTKYPPSDRINYFGFRVARPLD
jgi:formylglycine-generating enzyme required for sulfatase activity